MKKAKPKTPTKSKVRLSDSMPKEPESGFLQAHATRQEIFCEDLGLTICEFENVWIEGLRCKGNDLRERRFLHRVWKRDTLFQDEGYYLQFLSASAPSTMILAQIGPFEDQEESIECYDYLVGVFGFNRDLIINKPDEDDSLFDIEDEGLFDIEDGLFDIDEDDELGLFDIP